MELKSLGLNKFKDSNGCKKSNIKKYEEERDMEKMTVTSHYIHYLTFPSTLSFLIFHK